MILIAICPICGADVRHEYDANSNIVCDENGVSLWYCEYPWLHPAEPGQDEEPS